MSTTGNQIEESLKSLHQLTSENTDNWPITHEEIRLFIVYVNTCSKAISATQSLLKVWLNKVPSDFANVIQLLSVYNDKWKQWLNNDSNKQSSLYIWLQQTHETILKFKQELN